MSGRQMSRFWGVVLTLGLTGGGLIFLFGTMEESRSINIPMPVFAAIAAAGLYVALMRGAIGKAIAKMLEGGSSDADEQTMTRIDQLEDRLADLGMDQHRVAELEERLDFAERLLSQREPIAELRKPEH
jgi:hypothetical protein